jgi:tetratricopeptide (TPR) repeat protein
MRSMRSLVPFALFLLLAAAALLGQAGLGQIRLTGQVKADDGNPIKGAQVVIRWLQSERTSGRIFPKPNPRPETAVFETRTDKKGFWSYTGLTSGLWLVTASADGYNSAFRTCKLLKAGDIPRVELVLDKLAVGGSDTLAPGLLESADELAFKKDFEGAIALYRQYLDLDPEAIMVASAIGDCLMDEGDLEAALAQFQAVADKTAKDPRERPLAARALARLGECRMRRGETDEAVQCWRSSLSLLPLDPEVPFNLAEVLFADRKLEEAARYYRIAAELGPGWADPYYKLGLVEMARERFDRARKAFRQAAAIDPYSRIAAQARDMLKELDRIKK